MASVERLTMTRSAHLYKRFGFNQLWSVASFAMNEENWNCVKRNYYRETPNAKVKSKKKKGKM
jgi:hypothetical protein